MEAVSKTKPQAHYTLHHIADLGIEAFNCSGNRTISDLETHLVEVAVSMGCPLSHQDCRSQLGHALSSAIAKHPDLPDFAEAMLIAALGLLPCVPFLTWEELVESLYCVAKHADFLKPSRLRSVLARVSVGEQIQ